MTITEQELDDSDEHMINYCDKKVQEIIEKDSKDFLNISRGSQVMGYWKVKEEIIKKRDERNLKNKLLKYCAHYCPSEVK